MVTIIKKGEPQKSIKKKIAEITNQKSPKTISDFFGVIDLKFDPVGYQREARNDKKR
jgi:hypothetical protein